MSNSISTTCRYTLVGMTIGTHDSESPDFLCYRNRPQVTSSLLAKSNINFVVKVMEERCGKCGLLNGGSQKNTYPWFVAIRNTDWPDNEYFTGTLVSKEWVVTSASAFGFPVDAEKWHIIVGQKPFDVLPSGKFLYVYFDFDSFCIGSGQ